MLKWFALASAILLQAQAQDKDTLYKKDLGISISKPPKNEEWEFKDKGFFANSQLVAAHKVDNVVIEVFAQDKATGFGYFDPKQVAETEWKNVSGFPNVKDPKKVNIGPSKLPGGGAGNVSAHLLEMTFKRADKPMELKMWCFVGKENQQLYKITYSGDDGMYKKHQKMIDYILSTVRIYKIK